MLHGFRWNHTPSAPPVAVTISSRVRRENRMVGMRYCSGNESELLPGSFHAFLNLVAESSDISGCGTADISQNAPSPRRNFVTLSKYAVMAASTSFYMQQIVWLLFFLSGACGLVYEVLWCR